MNRTLITSILIVAFIAIGAWLLFFRGDSFDLPEGETRVFVEESGEGEEESVEENIHEGRIEETLSGENPNGSFQTKGNTMKRSETKSNRHILITDGVKHSIPIAEILSGGPGKDGIPSIDNPKFWSRAEADAEVEDFEIGLGVIRKGDARFYPYFILVWHEIVNDVVGGDPLLITYCPLCRTGIVFERVVDGKEVEFGVSGRLWKSNLLMYDRTGNVNTESLWSQVLGEAVLGPETGQRLDIIPSDTTTYGEWKSNHPDTKVLSDNTGIARPYGNDPYGNYYVNRDVSFGATFTDTRLHPKAFVLGIEIDGSFKAYHDDAIPEGTTRDVFAGNEVIIERNGDKIRMFVGPEKVPLSYIGGFWFSWLAVHLETELYK